MSVRSNKIVLDVCRRIVVNKSTHIHMLKSTYTHSRTHIYVHMQTHSHMHIVLLQYLKDLVADATERVDFMTFVKQVNRGL